MLRDIVIWLCLSIIPYWFFRLFYNFYMVQKHYEVKHDHRFDKKKLNRYEAWYHICMIIGLPLTLLLAPVTTKSYRILYSRYVSDVTEAFRIGSAPELSYDAKREKIYQSNLPVGWSTDPIDFSFPWFEE